MATNERIKKLSEFLYWYLPNHLISSLEIKDITTANSILYFLRNKTKAYKQQRKVGKYEFPWETIREFRVTGLKDENRRIFVERINKTVEERMGDDPLLSVQTTQLQERQHELWLQTNGAEYSFTGTYRIRRYRKKDEEYWEEKQRLSRRKGKKSRKA